MLKQFELQKQKNALEASQKIDSILSILLIALSTGDVQEEDIENVISTVWDINTNNLKNLSMGE
ncbi:hypothetical protein [Pantoea stewartii]|uniref:Uncharacterized protein n=1 Tax=Pantoea stewartii subsp. stewartii DC283 TaxID=660596 RepID=A0ABN4Z7V3_PANSE|nr:hypothetical protein [Pantoea stewartii]ARF49631.1 hypothetical protein DSJ_09945 [Pantoea stewartii subsp. stewartii DC283]KAB0559994.1 hypothetical protein F7Q90_00965 [Pantoea stewartii subsp. stewartii]